MAEHLGLPSAIVMEYSPRTVVRVKRDLESGWFQGAGFAAGAVTISQESTSFAMPRLRNHAAKEEDIREVRLRSRIDRRGLENGALIERAHMPEKTTHRVHRRQTGRGCGEAGRKTTLRRESDLRRSIDFSLCRWSIF